MKVIIDRFEEDYAIVECEDALYRLPRALVGDAREGDAVMIMPLGRNAGRDGEGSPHSLFERLRKKRRRRS